MGHLNPTNIETKTKERFSNFNDACGMCGRITVMPERQAPRSAREVCCSSIAPSVKGPSGQLGCSALCKMPGI